MQYKLDIQIFDNYIHYYLDGTYIGMLVFDKGELSDFRAIIRKNALKIDTDTLYAQMKTALYTLLNHYLAERLFLEADTLTQTKESIVKSNDPVLTEAAERIKTDTRSAS